MKINKIEFTGNLQDATEKRLNKYKLLFADLIKNDSIDFDNYEINENNIFSIPVYKDTDWSYNPSYIIFWNESGNFSFGKYIKFDSNGVSVGFRCDDDMYINLFIGEEYFEKHFELMEGKTVKWTNGIESFVKSNYVQKHKILLKYLNWSRGESCLPDYLYIDFHLKGYKSTTRIIKKFSKIDNTLKDLKKFIKFYEDFN
jgi:hypothetical protein